jgi:acylphosphatase
LGLVGFVRNEHDTTVYIEAQGPRANVDQFLHWLEHHGPASAEVTKVEHHTTFLNIKDYGSFKIIY